MDKFEKQFREKLQERKLVPSENAWHKIESQLGNKAQPLKNKRYRWYAIAAGFIGLLIISIAYFNILGTEFETIGVVDVDTEVKDTPVLDKQVLNNDVVDEKETAEKIEGELESELAEKGKDILVLPQPIDKSIMTENIQENDKTTAQEPIKTSEQELIDQKLNEVLTEVINLENQNIEVTNAEIDSLLWAAQRELLAGKVFQENGTVDAMALLNEVEDELDRTFRGEIFEKLKEGFFKVRTAVADRNN